MKDEEMAEKIANKRCHEIMCYGHCSFNSPKHHRCGEWHREYNCALEGIKAGRPQWHDLRKDKNDLPKEPNEKMSVNETWAYVKFFDNTYGLVDKGALKNYKGAIAWCELPTFDKE